LAAGFSLASNLYVQHATPNVEPLVFSEATRTNVRRVHTISGQAVTITQKTTGMIHNLIDTLAHKMGANTPKAPGASILNGTDEESKDGPATVEQAKKRKFLNKVLLSTDMIISAIEQSTTTIIKSGSKSIAEGVHHK
jgi:spartin